MDQFTIVQSLYAAIFRGIEAPQNPAGNQSFISLEWPGLPIDAQQLGNPWSPDNLTGSAQALEDFSVLVDQVPAVSPIYTSTAVSLESVYGLLLDATVRGGAPESAITKAFAAAKAKFGGIVRG